MLVFGQGFLATSSTWKWLFFYSYVSFFLFSKMHGFKRYNCSTETNFTAQQGELDFYFYPKTYPNSFECHWRIHSNSFTPLIFLTLDLIQTECSWDWIYIYELDFLANTKTQLASLCGNETTATSRFPSIFVSNQSALHISFVSDSDIPSYGFRAHYSLVAPCYLNCLGHGQCVNGNQCQCDPMYTGLLCEQETRGNAPIAPRYGPTSLYDAEKDRLLVAGGTNLNQSLPWSMFEWNVASSQWTDLSNPSPLSDYSSFLSHQLFQFASNLYLLGQTQTSWVVFKYQTTQWQVIPFTTSLKPPLLYDATLVPALEEKKIFLVGGGLRALPQFTPNRSFFAFDFETMAWIQLNSTYVRFTTFNSIYGSPAIYRSSNRKLYVFAPFKILIYHIASDRWFTVSYDDVHLSLLSSWVWQSATFMDPFVFFTGGQLTPFQNLGSHLPCYASTFFILDLDCWSLTQPLVSDPYFTQPMLRHASFVRFPPSSSSSLSSSSSSLSTVSSGSPTSLSLFLLGGLRQGKESNALESLTIPLLKIQPECRVATWCSLYNDCDDCLLQPGCGWCEDKCSYQCKLRQCPERRLLQLSEIYNDVLSGVSFMDFKIYINEPDLDLFFYLSNEGNQLLLSILNLPSVSTSSSLSSSSSFSFPSINASSTPWRGPFILFQSKDVRRFGGFYIFRLQNPVNEVVSFTFVVSTSVPIVPPKPVDVDPYVSLGFGLLSLVLSLGLLFKKFRRTANRGTLSSTIRPVPPSFLPPMYTIDLPSPRLSCVDLSTVSNLNHIQSLNKSGGLRQDEFIPIPLSAELSSSFVYVTYLIRLPSSPSSSPSPSSSSSSSSSTSLARLFNPILSPLMVATRPFLHRSTPLSNVLVTSNVHSKSMYLSKLREWVQSMYSDASGRG